MAEVKRIPLDELLFGPPFVAMVGPPPALADLISAWYREYQAQLLRDQSAKRSSVPPPRRPLEER